VWSLAFHFFEVAGNSRPFTPHGACPFICVWRCQLSRLLPRTTNCLFPSRKLRSSRYFREFARSNYFSPQTCFAMLSKTPLSFFFRTTLSASRLFGFSSLNCREFPPSPQFDSRWTVPIVSPSTPNSPLSGVDEISF